MNKRVKTCGFSLVELLIALVIIAILISLLLPAVQGARETGRRIQCANNLHQMGIALQNYHHAMRRFPVGIVNPNRTFWTAQLLPYIEQVNLYQSLDFSHDWTSQASTNAQACRTYLSAFRCPSSAAPKQSDVQGVRDRVPANYLVVGSGTDTRESGIVPGHIGLPKRDGLMYVNNRTSFSRILDGTSNSLAIGEALFKPEVSGQDLDGERIQIVDHWYIGSDGVRWRPTGMREASEAIGSTGVPLNAVFQDTWIDAKELCFSSLHTGGCMFVFADGHVQFLSTDIDAEIYSMLGTIAGQEMTSISE